MLKQRSYTNQQVTLLFNWKWATCHEPALIGISQTIYGPSARLCQEMRPVNTRSAYKKLRDMPEGT